MSLASAFWRRVTRGGPVHPILGMCWAWMGKKNQKGRGQLLYQGTIYSAPAVSYRLSIGPVPPGLSVLHQCDNPNCVNPAHLFLGDQFDNMRDMSAKGRAANVSGEKNPNAKLSDNDVAEVRRRHKRWCPVNGTTALAREFRVSADAIQRIVNNRRC
jgi:hypothetical protein